MLALAACGESGPAEPPPDVLLISIDTLRVDFVSAYGASYADTPAIDRLAAEGARFDAHYTVMSHTAPAHCTMLTGLFPSEHGLRMNGRSMSERTPYLPEALRHAGYRTAATVGGTMLSSRFGFGRGFERYDEPPPPSRGDMQDDEHDAADYTILGEEVVDKALEALAEDDGRPLFLWVHMYDPHDPYSAPGAGRATEEELALVRPYLPESDRFEEAELARNWVKYRQEVQYSDRQIARLMEAWDARPGADRSIVVLTSDHGEGLFEHGYRGHGALLYEEQLRVPMILRKRDVIEPGSAVDSLTSMVDLCATVTDLAGLPAIEDRGRSLTEHLRARGEPARPVFAERRDYGKSLANRENALRAIQRFEGTATGATGDDGVIAVVQDGWKLLWSPGTRSELYDLVNDPDEAVNLVEEEDERARAMLDLIAEWLERARTADERGGDPPDEDVERMLDALGYGGGD